MIYYMEENIKFGILALTIASAVVAPLTFIACADLNVNVHQSNRQANPDVAEGTVKTTFARGNDVSSDTDTTKVKASLK